MSLRARVLGRTLGLHLSGIGTQVVVVVGVMMTTTTVVMTGRGRVGLCWWRRHAACVRCLPDKWRLAICDSEKPLHASVDWTRSATNIQRLCFLTKITHFDSSMASRQHNTIGLIQYNANVSMKYNLMRYNYTIQYGCISCNAFVFDIIFYTIKMYFIQYNKLYFIQYNCF